MRTVPFPNTPAQVRACLLQAEEDAVTVERDGAALLVIMPVKKYVRLAGLHGRTVAADEVGGVEGRVSGTDAGPTGSGKL